MAAGEDKREEYLKDNDVFRRNAFLLIDKMVEMSNKTKEDTSMLVDEFLHSVFFLGYIRFPKCSIESIFPDNETYQEFQELYPGPFIHYLSQLPRRSPFSCVLDMIVHWVGQDNEEQIKVQLKALARQLKENTKLKILYSTALCISSIQESTSHTSSSVKYYGVSMSMFGSPAGRIMVAASCFSGTWDDYVADAVMTYYPKKEKKPYFDGTLKLPDNVTCQTFRINDGQPMDPCVSCKNLFGLQTESKKVWAYGNCAEVESVSKLLKNEKHVRDLVNSNLLNEEDRRRAKDCVLKELKSLLEEKTKFEWNGNFYTPQTPQFSS